ncbi:2OG-Fe(II) oxygenase [Dokdonella sp. MW10]|uniref:2OG-Fe(II) oxygenase n=1 Tax=Dokdonella sp. MW10 TaxID=2992926 RepID=UPI003F7F8055
MFNPDIDFSPWSARLSERTRVLIPGALQPAVAQALHERLARVEDWDLAFRDGHASTLLPAARYAALGQEGRRDLLARLARESLGRYGFAYDSCMLVERYMQQPDPDDLLHRIVEMMHREPFLAFVRNLVGDASIRRSLVQATRYLPGHFLRRHEDIVEDGRDRRYAFVFNLGREWQADWGGLLQFLDARGDVVETFVPAFNSLSLFKVPQPHAVSLVGGWAEQPRYALTGWFMA